MTDTIVLILRRSDVNTPWDIEEITNRLDDDSIAITMKRDGSRYVNGKIKNMKVYLTPDYIKISGSLSKFFFNNNLQTLTHEEIVLAIESLESEIGLPIQRAIIKRIDIARNIIVKRSISECLSGFDKPPAYHMDTTKDGLLFKHKNRTHSMRIYDKLAELRKKNREFYLGATNGILRNKKVIRCEVKIENRVNKQLGYPTVKAVHLRSITFFRKLNDFWISKFDSLPKKKSFEFNGEIENYGQFKKELLVKAINDIGLKQLFEMLEELRKKGNLTSNQKAYAKADIRKVMAESVCLIELHRTDELMTSMHFLHKNYEKDEFTRLKDWIVRSPEIKSSDELIEPLISSTLDESKDQFKGHKLRKLHW